jgi:hypothetical protein
VSTQQSTFALFSTTTGVLWATRHYWDELVDRCFVSLLAGLFPSNCTGGDSTRLPHLVNLIIPSNDQAQVVVDGISVGSMDAE